MKFRVVLFLLCTVIVATALIPLSQGQEGSFGALAAPGYSTPVPDGAWQPLLSQYHASGSDKFDASLQLAFHLWNERLRLQAQPSPQSDANLEALETITLDLARQIDLHPNTPDPGVNVLIQTTDNAEELERLGIPVQARVGNVATAYIPFSRLQEVAALPSVVYIEAGRVLQSFHDASVAETGAPQVWSSGNVTGTGVIVGVIDSGIDPFHPDFINPDGTTRIKYLLDLSDPGDPDGDGRLNGPVFGGTMYTEAQINAALANPGWFYRSSDGQRSIPDNSSAGVTSQINVPTAATITSAAVDVYIDHDEISDLQVVLTCPSGTQVTLHNRTGRGGSGVIGTFDVTACNGQQAQGTWRLTVADRVAENTGRLVFWNVHVNRAVRMTDLNGHGAHVAGSAAGNGRGTADGSYKGVAPGAFLIAVRGSQDYIGGFSTPNLVNALNFIDEKARELGLPYVVNMSLGGHLGPHDGTNLDEQAIDNLVGSGRPGKAIVVAAGNQGNKPIYTGGTLRQGGTAALVVNVPGDGGSFLADIWYKGSDTFGVGVVAPDGSGRNPAPVPPGSNRQCYTHGSPIVYVVCIQHMNNNPFNGDKEITVRVITRAPGRWQLILHGDSVVNGQYDAWLLSGCCGWVNALDQKRIGMPGTARNAITVGAYTTKSRWRDVNGNTQTAPGATSGAIASFSSDGPTRDGRVKPEIAAPGQVICSTLSGQSPPGSPGAMYPDSGFVCSGGRHGASQGTSMAAPHVAGAVALLLSANPSLDAAQIKTMLTNAARQDRFTGAVPNNRWGYGKLDVAKAFFSPAAPSLRNAYLPLVIGGAGAVAPGAPTPIPPTSIPDPTPTLTTPTPSATPTPTHTSTPTPSPTSTRPPTSTPTRTPTPSGWDIVVSTDFEGAFPGPWDVFDIDGAANGEFYWGRRNCRAYAGSFSGWGVGAGASGASLSCGANYPNNAGSYMVIRSPFSLEGATAAQLNFKLWLNTEQTYDGVCILASTREDFSDLDGVCLTGNSRGWADVTVDLSNFPRLGNLLGKPQVWVIIAFVSDSSVTFSEGAYVDDIVVRRCPRGATCPTGSALEFPAGVQITEFPSSLGLTR